MIYELKDKVKNYPGNTEFRHFSTPPSSADSRTPWTDFLLGLQTNNLVSSLRCWATVNRDLTKRLPTGSEESVMITSKASWFFFMNSKPSPTWRVSLGLKKPLAIPGRYFLDTLMTSFECAKHHNQSSFETLRKQLLATPETNLVDLAQNHRLHQRVLHHFPQHAAIATANDQHLRKGKYND